jgi:hypothetical protein
MARIWLGSLEIRLQPPVIGGAPYRRLSRLGRAFTGILQVGKVFWTIDLIIFAAQALLLQSNHQLERGGKNTNIPGMKDIQV